MSILFTLTIVSLIVVYAHLDSYFSKAEEAFDKKFVESLETIDPNSLSKKEKHMLSVMLLNYENKKIVWLFSFALLFDLPRQIFAIFIPKLREKKSSKSPELSKVIFFWSMSHINRSAPFAIISHVALALTCLLMAIRIKYVEEPNKFVVVRASSKLQENDYFHCKAA